MKNIVNKVCIFISIVFSSIYLLNIIGKEASLNKYQIIFIFCYLFLLFVGIALFIQSRSTRKVNKKNILIILTISLLLCFLNKNILVPKVYEDKVIKITATGKKNESSISYEVWIDSIISNGNEIEFADINLTDNWVLKDEMLLSNKGKISNSFEIHIEELENLEIIFGTHKWSGIVEVEYDNQIEEIDLYSINGGEKKINIEGEYKRTEIEDIFFLYGSYVVIIVVILFLLSIFRWKENIIKFIFTLTSVIYTLSLFQYSELFKLSLLSQIIISVIYGMASCYALLKIYYYKERNNIKVIQIIILSCVITFMLFGAELFLIPRNYQISNWITFIFLLLWVYPIIIFIICLFYNIEIHLKKDKQSEKKEIVKRKSSFVKISIWIISILFGLAVGISFYKMFSYVDKESVVMITPSGEKNEDALGYEVLIDGIYVDGTLYIPNAFNNLPKGWKNEKGTIFGYGKESLVLKLPRARDIKILFYKHKWSGIVKIEDNGDEKYIDLFSDKGIVSYQVKGNKEYSIKDISIILIISIAIIIVTKYVLISLVFVWKSNVKAKKFFITLLFMEILIYSIYIIASYPASISTDSKTQLLQALGNATFTDAHPAIHTLLIKYLTLNGKVLVLFPIAQMLSISLLNSTILSFLYAKGINRKCLLVFGIVSTLMINNGIYVTIIWKDELYSICLLLLTYLLYRMERDNNYIRIKGRIFLVSVSLTGIKLLRHNGIVVFIIIVLLFIIWSFIKKNWCYILSALLSILLVIVIRGPIYNLAGVENKSSGTTVSSMIHGIVYAAILNDVPEETEKFLTDIMPIEKWEKCYTKYSANELSISSIVYEYDVSNKLKEFGTKKMLEEYCRVLFYKPIRLIEDRLFGIDIMWNVIQDEGYNWRVANDTYEIGVVENKMGWYRHDNIFTNLIKILSEFSMEHKILDAIFWRAGIWVGILLLLIYYGYIRKKRNYMFYIPVVGNMISLCLAMAWQDFRYVYFINLCVPYLILLCLVDEEKVKKLNS